MGLNASAKNSILNAMIGMAGSISIATTCYIGLGTVDDSGKFVEPSTDAGYYRTSIGTSGQNGTYLMSTPSEGTTSNKSVIYLSESTGAWGTLTHFGLFSSASSSSQPFFTGELSSSVTIDSGYIPIFRVGSLTITIN